jgi:UDP-N-acetylmuramate-alanine ligase
MTTETPQAPNFEQSTITELPPMPARFHFVGIGGISMSGLARILHDWGYAVTGSDRQASAATDLLQKLGIEVQIGHEDGAMAGQADVLVVTPRAIPGAPNEIRAAVANDAEIVRRGQLLGMIANARVNIAASGSHGKSTTSGMLTSALTELGADPSYSVGAMVGTTGRNADSGQGPHMVVEADEFDRALLWLKPDIAIVSTVSFDHPDVFADQADYDRAFIDFARGVRPGGTYVVSADDPGCKRVTEAVCAMDDFAGTIVTFGEQDGADWRYRRTESGWQVIDPEGNAHPLALQVPGAHNVANATAAIIALTTLGFPVEDAMGKSSTRRPFARRYSVMPSTDVTRSTPAGRAGAGAVWPSAVAASDITRAADSKTRIRIEIAFLDRVFDDRETMVFIAPASALSTHDDRGGSHGWRGWHGSSRISTQIREDPCHPRHPWPITLRQPPRGLDRGAGSGHNIGSLLVNAAQESQVVPRKTFSFRPLTAIALAVACLATPLVTARAAAARGGEHSIELNVDTTSENAQLSLISYTFTGGAPAKFSFGNRFTVLNDQAPFRLEAVSAFLAARSDDGAGFQVGEPIGIHVFVDAASTGVIENAIPVYEATTQVLVQDAFNVYPLAQPVVVRQGDVYVFVADLTTDLEPTQLPIILPANGGSTDARAFTTTSTGSADDPQIYFPATDLPQGDGNLEGNFVVRALGDPALPNEPVTGGGEPGDPTLPAPTNFLASGTSSVTLRWTPPALPPPPAPAAVAEVEPNDGPAEAQAAPANATVSGSANSNQGGAPGGFSGDDVEDWYRIEVTETTSVQMTLSGFGNTDFDLFVYPPAGPFETDEAIAFSGGAAGEVEHIILPVVAPGTYLIGVSAFDPDVPAQTSYTLAVVTAPRVVRYNVYSGATPDFAVGPATFVGAARSAATSFPIAEPAPGAYYRIAAVIGGEESAPTPAVLATLAHTTDTVGVYVPSTSVFFLRDENSPGPADYAFQYGAPDFGLQPLSGDWDGDGDSTVGLYDSLTGFFFLTNASGPGGADLVFSFGPGGLSFRPLVGDWNGDGIDTVGIYDPATGNFFLRNANAPGGADAVFSFGPGGLGWVPLAGDWDGDGDDTAGVYAPSSGTFFLRNENASGGADLLYSFGPGGTGFAPVVGDWNADGFVTVGLYGTATGVFFLRDQHAGGPADYVFTYGPAGARAVVGDWDWL